MHLPIAVIALDVDHFKTYNDNYGHPAGDQVLQQLANVMLEMTSRASEFAARMGGEEFLLFYSTVNRTAALSAEERRVKVLGLEISREKSLTAEYVTVSIGVITLRARVGAGVLHQITGVLRHIKGSGRRAIPQ